MKHPTIITMTMVSLLVSGFACSYGEEEGQAKSTSSHEMTETTESSHDSPHAHASDGDAHADGGHGDMGHSSWASPAEAANRSNPVEATAESLERGATAYQANCVLCHGPGGKGDGPLAEELNSAPPDLAMMAPMHPAGDLAWKIETGKGAMPAWKNILSDTQIWDVVNYLKSLATDSDAGDMGHSEAGEETHGHAHSDHHDDGDGHDH